MTVFRYQATWTVDTGPEEASTFRLLPIAPRVLVEQIPGLAYQLLEAAGDTTTRVGGMSVTVQQEPASGTPPEASTGRRSTPQAPQGQVSITCPACGMTSYHPGDVVAGYCGNCHAFTSPPTYPVTRPAR